MPIFLNRHEFFKVTAADIAQVHLENLRMQQEFGCWVLAYWFNQKRGTTFCLIDAPDLESVKEMHCHIHHSYPGQIIQVEEGLIEAFLSSIDNPTSSARKNTSPSLVFQKPIFSAVMVLKLYCGDPLLTKESILRKRLFEDFKNFSQKLVRRNKGRIFKSAYDGCIYTFNSISQSIKSALQIQHELDVRIKINGEKTIVLSIGIDGGRSMHEHCHIFEETNNLAQRLCCIAGSNQIVISSTVKEQFQMEDLETLEKSSSLKSLSYKEGQFLIRLMDIIELNYREDFKIGDFCKIMGESRSQLYRKIIEVTNLPPIALINEFRLNKAIELMNMEKGSNSSQIAFESGFNSLSYFSRRFKHRYGFLPSVYLNRTY